jgi:serine/threonine protein kinase
MWSLGVTLSTFYTELRWLPAHFPDDASDTESYGGEQMDEDGSEVEDREVRWSRKSLFKSSRGELGLMWSIFRLLGTPTDETWPVSYTSELINHFSLSLHVLILSFMQGFCKLPGAQMLQFQVMPPDNLDSHLPNLPAFTRPSASSGTHYTYPHSASDSALGLIQKLLVCDPSRRPTAAEALEHPWFNDGIPLILPRGHNGAGIYIPDTDKVRRNIQVEWEGMDLGKILKPAIDRAVASWTELS